MTNKKVSKDVGLRNQTKRDIERRIHIKRNTMIRRVSDLRLECEGKSDVDKSIKMILGRPYQKHDKADFYLWNSQLGTFMDLVNLRLAIIKKFKINKKSLEVDGWRWNRTK